jgi:hypothetical protein
LKTVVGFCLYMSPGSVTTITHAQITRFALQVFSPSRQLHKHELRGFQPDISTATLYCTFTAEFRHVPAKDVISHVHIAMCVYTGKQVATSAQI